MIWTSRLGSLWRNLFHRQASERELDEEVRAYAAILEDEHAARGLAPEEARRQALVEMGGIEQISRGVFLVNAGSLFPALHRMEEAGWLSSSWGESDNNRRARYYQLTRAGRQQLKAETQEWGRISVAIAAALRG